MSFVCDCKGKQRYCTLPRTYGLQGHQKTEQDPVGTGLGILTCSSDQPHGSSSFGKEIENMGGHLNAYTSREQTVFLAWTLGIFGCYHHPVSTFSCSAVLYSTLMCLALHLHMHERLLMYSSFCSKEIHGSCVAKICQVYYAKCFKTDLRNGREPLKVHTCWTQSIVSLKIRHSNAATVPRYQQDSCKAQECLNPKSD